MTSRKSGSKHLKTGNLKGSRAVAAVAALVVSALTSHAAEQKLVLGAGCFWCVEALFEAQPGVISVVSGFAGGTTQNPTYEDVCTETTGHKEVVEITFDEERTNLESLFKTFYKSHDATEGRGVEPDFGDSYKPIILFANDAQREAAEQAKAAEAARLGKPVKTIIQPLEKFFPAAANHQDFVKRNPNNPYVKGVSIPRLKKAGGPP